MDHFNKDYKKGLAAMQAIHLLPQQPLPGESEQVRMEARKLLAMRLGQFLRTCPGLNKTVIGELLGDPDVFYLQVRVCMASRCVAGFAASHKLGHSIELWCR